MSSFDMVAYLEANFEDFGGACWLLMGKIHICRSISWCCQLCFFIFLNQFITLFVFFHCFMFVLALTLRLIFSTICLFTLPNSGLHGLISLHVGLFLKFSLGSLSVTNASLWAVTFILSLSSSLSAMFLSSAVLCQTVLSSDSYIVLLFDFHTACCWACSCYSFCQQGRVTLTIQWKLLFTFLNLMFSIIYTRPSSKSLNSGMEGDDFVQLKPYVSFVDFSMLGFKKKNVLHRTFSQIC